MPSRRARNSAFGVAGTRDGGGEAGTEEPMTDKVGRMGLEAVAVAVSASQDVDDLLRTVGVYSATGASVGAGMDAVDKTSRVLGPAHGATISSGGRDNVVAGGMS